MRRPPFGEAGGRWPGFRFRAGDIVISTPRKSGTTWMQMICALLIFQTPDLPAPLWQLSPWLDTPDVPPEHVDAQLAAQRHRRFIKTHTPLAGIPADGRVTYVVTARHPLDAFVSMYHQDRLIGPPPGLPGPAPPHRPVRPRPPAPEVSPEQLRAALLAWISGDEDPGRHPASLAGTMRHLSGAWSRRHDRNVVLVHYDDLLSGLEGQMRRLAARLGIAVGERSWPALVEAATFERMRGRDDVLVPPPPGIVADNALFFRRGTSGAGREILGEEETARYLARVAGLGPPELIAWLHRPVARH
jgi:aryl sulfotransferase